MTKRANIYLDEQWTDLIDQLGNNLVKYHRRTEFMRNGVINRSAVLRHYLSEAARKELPNWKLK